MSKESPTKNPTVELANKDWVLKELMDTERRIEKAFHEQTQFLSGKTDSIQKETGELRRELAAQTRWMVGMMLTMIVAVVVAIFLK